MVIRSLASSLVLAVLVAFGVADARAGGVNLEHPWIRATPAGAAVAGGFLEIRNDGDTPERLIGGTADFAGRVEIHEMAMDGEVMRMRALAEGLPIAPGATVILKPGSYHVMFLDLKRPLVSGQSLQGTLLFERAGAMPVTWEVKPMGAMGMKGGTKDMTSGEPASPVGQAD